jgi:hypothetical protein
VERGNNIGRCNGRWMCENTADIMPHFFWYMCFWLTAILYKWHSTCRAWVVTYVGLNVNRICETLEPGINFVIRKYLSPFSRVIFNFFLYIVVHKLFSPKIHDYFFKKLIYIKRTISNTVNEGPVFNVKFSYNGTNTEVIHLFPSILPSYYKQH